MRLMHPTEDNRGFTLVELLVTILVSSFVILAATMFISMATQTYNSTNTEVSLQMESQIATNLIEDLLIEATSCEYISNFDYLDAAGNTGSCELLKIGTTTENGSQLYLVIHDEANSKLLLKKCQAPASKPEIYKNVVGDLENQADIQALVGRALASERPALLANHITDFKVSPTSAEIDTDDIIRLSLSLSFQGKDYSSTANISLRNGTHR